MTGVYAVLLGGIILSGITLLLEIMWKHHKVKSRNPKSTLITEFNKHNDSLKFGKEEALESSVKNIYSEDLPKES